MTFDSDQPPHERPVPRPPPRGPAQGRASRGREPLSGDVVPLDDPYYVPPEDQSLMHNPYVLAGLAVAAAIVLAVVVVIVFGGGGSAGDDVLVNPLTPGPGRGVPAKSIATASVREGPGTEYLEIGQLRSGLDVELVGRNNDSSWYQIYFPPKSLLRGWVPSSALKVPGGAADSLAVVAVTPIARPTVLQPTAAPAATKTASPIVTPTGTAAPAAAPDLAISVLNNACQPGIPLVVTLRNAGTTPVSGRLVRVTVTTPGGGQSVADNLVNLEPGEAVNLGTNQPIQGPRTTARADLIGAPGDANAANNTVECVLQGSGPTAVPPPVDSPGPTRTPRPQPTATPD